MSSETVNGRVLAYLREPHTFTEVCRHMDWPKGTGAWTLDKLRRQGLVERLERGVYVATRYGQ